MKKASPKKKKPAKKFVIKPKKEAAKTLKNPTPRFEPELKIYPTPEALVEETAHFFMTVARAAVEERGRFVAALSGGTTPKGLFKHLSEEPYLSLVPWAKTFLFWVDERHVPFTDPMSNFKMTQENLLSKVPVPVDHVFPMTDGSLPVGKAASIYEGELKRFFGRKDLPVFDLALMGMGDDGHTASLFPGMEQLNEREKWVVGYFVDPEKKERVTLTFPVLNNARILLGLMEGAKKASRLKEVLEGPQDPPRYPIQYLRPVKGRLIFALDEAAASLIDKK